MKNPIGLVSDVHLHNWSTFAQILPTGENERLMITLGALREAADDMIAKGCKTLYIAGDLFHVRGSLPPSVLNPTLDTFKYIISRMDVRIIPGNHDLESDDTRALTNATQALAALGCTVVTEPTFFVDDEVLMVPWEPSLRQLREVLREQGSKHTARAAIIHAPLNKVIAGIPDHGLDAEELGDIGYSRVFVGHYHNRKRFDIGSNQVWSVGALNHQTWNDVNTRAGYIIMRGDGAVEEYETSSPKFVDFDETLSSEESLEQCRGNYVRVKLGQATEKEIALVRELALGELEARRVVIHATPKRVTSERKASIKAGSSLEASVFEFVGNAEVAVDRDALMRECESIMNQAAAES